MSSILIVALVGGLVLISLPIALRPGKKKNPGARNPISTRLHRP